MAVVILTDTFWPRPFSTASLRKNWRLYLLMLPATLAGAAAVFRMLSKAPTAGFSVEGITPLQYALTQARAIFVYFRLALLPIGQSVDHDFPVSHSPLEYGAIFWVLALTLLLVAAVRYRGSWPLDLFACFCSVWPSRRPRPSSRSSTLSSKSVCTCRCSG